MNRLLRKLAEKYVASEEEKEKFGKYVDMTRTEGWKTHVEMLTYLQGFIIQDMLSPEFTELEPIKKDTLQRAYAGVNEVLTFLVNPYAKARSIIAIKRHNNKMEATRRKRPEGETDG